MHALDALGNPTRRAILQKLRKQHLESAERNVARASYLRLRLSGGQLERN